VHSVALPNGGISNLLHLHLPVSFSIDLNFVGFLNTSYNFSLLVFEFTKTKDFLGSLQKTGDRFFSQDMNLNPGAVSGKQGHLVTLTYNDMFC
jgi:hypothetical protein